MTKQKIIKIALNQLLLYGTEECNIENISDRTGLCERSVRQLFRDGNHELLMDAVEYAGRTWVQKLKKEVAGKEDVNSKLNVLTLGYALGGEQFPESLSVYIDLWKMVKDKKDTYIRNRLRELYNFYTLEFSNIVNEIGDFDILQEGLKTYAFIMTLLSDVIHIQSIILENEVDFQKIKKVIEIMTTAFFQEVKEERAADGRSYE